MNRFLSELDLFLNQLHNLCVEKTYFVPLCCTNEHYNMYYIVVITNE